MNLSKVLNGLRGQNEPAQLDGKTGFWCQADCVFIVADSPHDVIISYRRQFIEHTIGVSHNHNVDAIREMKNRKKAEHAS
jgi:hypothetical protein